MSDMAIQSESYKGRLRSFYDDIVMDVVHTFFELKVLGTKSFHCFLKDNLHILFHKRKPRKRCCKCSEVSLANQNRLPELEKEQFELLYVYDHQSAAIQDNEHSDKRNECLHRYSPKSTTVSEGVITLDICLICILVKNCCITGTFPGNPAVLDQIKKCRNSIYHLGTQNTQVHQMFDAEWALLESSVLDLASTLGKAYIHGLKRRIVMINSKYQLLAEISRSVSDNVNEVLPKSVSDKVTERIVLELCNQKVQIDNLEIRTTFQPQQRESDTGEAIGDLNRCYVVWKFANPGNWDVERMADKLKCVSKLLDFSIEFVYAGSIILTTSASFAIFSSERGFTAVIRDFLQVFIKTIEVDTSKKAKVDTLIEIYWSAPVEYMPNKGDGQLSMTIKDHDTIVLNCPPSDSSEITTVGWIFRSGPTVKIISSTSAEKYNYSLLAPSLIIKNCEASDSGTYGVIVNSTFKSEIHVVIPEEIYREPMNVVPYYQETKQLQEIERAIGLDEKLVILKGIPGSGKTQTASKFCERYKMMYSIVAKLSLRDGSSLKQSLLELLEDKLKWQCTSNQTEISFAAVVETFKNYLNHGERNNLPFLLVVDDIGHSKGVAEIICFVSLIKKVSRLNIILALTTGEYLADLRSFSHSLVEFKGMAMDEYMGLFNHLMPGEQDDAIKNLVDVIGSTPIILATVLKYMANMNVTSATYLEKYKSKPIPMLEAISPYFDAFHNAKYPALMSQLLPLEHIKSISTENESKENLWKVLNLIPFLEYDTVSPVVLQACYRHLSNNIQDKKKTTVDLLVKKLSEFSLCQTAKISMHEVKKKECEGVMYSFHKVTMISIEFMEDKVPNERNSKLDFLLKLFCSEIDIDAGSDITVARNLLFVPHAKKLLSHIVNGSNLVISREQKFLIAYLFCAIDSTLLFDGTNDNNDSLMKARDFALAVIGHKSLATEAMCLQIEDILKCQLEEGFVKDFVLSKRRNLDEITCIRSAVREKTIDNNDIMIMNICENHYLTETEYNELEKLNLALSIKDLSKIMLAELFLHILLNSAVLLHYNLRVESFTTDESIRRRFTTGIETEIEISREFCSYLKTLLNEIWGPAKNVQLFICLQSDSIGQFLMYTYSRNSLDTSLDEKIEFWENLLENKQTECFDFGVIKRPKARFTAYCQGHVIDLLSDKIKKEPNVESKRDLYAKSKAKANTLMGQIQQMEEKEENYSWLVLAMLYIKCGNFLLQSEDCKDTKKAMECFENALEFERSRNACWSHYICEGYKGKIRCLRKLNQNSEAETLTQKVREMLRDQNRDELFYLSNQFNFC